MSARLAQFDSLLTRRRLGTTHTPARSAHVLRDPWGEPVAEFSRFPSDLDLLKAAHRVQGDDWVGVLADEAQTRNLNAPWRLALLRADRHGQARVCREPGPQWIGAAQASRPGARSAELRRDLCAAAVRQLWQSGWKLIG
ncbi:hypothetical protein [Roseateles chitosanitabidus]|uniref:hypothetical protein n=1 Tax=Roseateles chitosanitabidus TaxID=65048 RepID=UPI00083350BB|nr:hypothetical protein [Roseateles chitosanitabidus]